MTVQTANGLRRKVERAEIVSALLSKARTIPENLRVSDDGSRAIDIDNARRSASRRAVVFNDCKAKARGGHADRCEAARSYRRLAGLASIHDRAKACEALRRAVSLSPNDPALWAR